MLAYATRRLIATIPVLLVATFLIFLLVTSINDPRDRFLANPQLDEVERARIVADLNDRFDLDKPVPIRYAKWIGRAVTGDFGEAPSQGENAVGPLLRERAWNSAKIAIPAFVLVAFTALVLGVFSAVRQYSLSDYTITGLSFIGIAFPTFVLGIILQIFWGIWWPDWFNGSRPFYILPRLDDGVFSMNFVRSATLPVVTLATVFIAGESRFARASMLEVINADYMRTARAKGLSERRIILRHGLRNAMIPLVTLWALDFAALLGGSIITEQIFSWPGLGRLFLDGLFAQDLNLVMAIVMFTAFLAIVFNLIADLLYGVLDPRIRYD